jgi:hypothetical protein
MALVFLHQVSIIFAYCQEVLQLTGASLPIGGFAMAIITILLKTPSAPTPNQANIWQKILKLDLLGALITVPAAICLVLALQWGGSMYPWNDSRIIGLFVGSGCLFVVLAFVQFKLGDKGTFPPKVVKNRDILCAAGFSSMFGAGYYSLVYYLAVYYQSVKGYSALDAGIRILPLSISASISATGTGALITALGYYTPFMIVCMALFAAGAGSLTTLTVSTNYWHGFGFQILTGLGVGIGFEGGMIVAQKSVPSPSISIAISVVSFAMTLGGTIFLSVSQAVFNHGMLRGVVELAPQIDGQVLLNSGATDLHALLTSMGQGQSVGAVLRAYAEGTRGVFWLVMACATTAFIAACGLRWRSLKKSD